MESKQDGPFELVRQLDPSTTEQLLANYAVFKAIVQKSEGADQVGPKEHRRFDGGITKYFGYLDENGTKILLSQSGDEGRDPKEQQIASIVTFLHDIDLRL